MEKEMTLEQAKEALQFQNELLQQQTMEIGNLNTEKLSMSIQLNRRNKRVKELEDALQGMVKEPQMQEDSE